MTDKKHIRPVGKDFEQRVLDTFVRYTRHLLVGELSLELGYSLATVEHHLELLVDRGAIREMTPKEKKELTTLPSATVAYVLVDSRKFNTGET